jgi:hypothetical protein
MSVKLKGAARGAFIDFTDDSAKGDVIDLIAYGLEGAIHAESRKRAVSWIEDRFGIARMSDEDRKVMEAEARAKQAANAANAERDLKARRERAPKMFYAAGEITPDCAAALYLAGRGTPLDGVPHLNRRTFRFRPDCEYWLDPARPKLPALVSAMVDAAGNLCACHMTFLKADGSAKADVEKAKLMWPETAGLVIRATNGANGPAEPQQGQLPLPGTLMISEGVEDALSAAISQPELRSWAAGSLSGLLRVPDHPCADAYMIFRDNDWGKQQALQQFERAVARFRSFRKPVAVVAIPDDLGKDINDAIRQ